MNRAPRTATSMTVLPTRSSIIVNPAALFEEAVARVFTAFAPLSGDDRRDQGARPVQVRVGQEHAGVDTELLGGIDGDTDLKRALHHAEVRDPPVVVRPVQVGIDAFAPR